MAACARPGTTGIAAGVAPTEDDAERFDDESMALASAVDGSEWLECDPSADATAHTITVAASPDVPIFAQDTRGAADACFRTRSCLGRLMWRGPRTCLGGAFETTPRPCRLPKNEIWRARQ
jgi:hypothetical protein